MSAKPARAEEAPRPRAGTPLSALSAEKSGSSVEAATATVALALAAGLYGWTLRQPAPLGNIGLPPEGFRFFPGLATALGIGLAVAVVFTLLLSAAPALRARRASIALAAAGLYLSAGFPAIGKAAFVIGPLAVAVWIAWIEIRRALSLPASLLLALHAGAFISALGFYHGWARYAYGWPFALGNAAALFKLLL